MFPLLRHTNGWINCSRMRRRWMTCWLGYGFYGEAKDGSDWTRDRELSEWIAESQVDWSAWRGVERLLEVLLRDGRPIPVVLVTWALEVAARIRRPLVRKKGRDGTQNILRDRNIAMAVNVMRNLGYPATSNTGQSACHTVAKHANLSYEAVRKIWLSHKNMTTANYLDLSTCTWRGRHTHAEK